MTILANFIIFFLIGFAIFDYFKGSGLYSELYYFFSKLSEIIRMGGTLDEGIELVRQDAVKTLPNRFFRLNYPASKIAQMIREGSSFSEAMKSFWKVFPPFACNIIKIGEESGNLLWAMDELKSFLLNRRNFIGAFSHFIVYPAFLLYMLLVMTNFLVTYILPTFIELLKCLDLEIPGVTKLIIATVRTTRNPLLLIFLFSILFIFFIITIMLIFLPGDLRKKILQFFPSNILNFFKIFKLHEYFVFARTMSVLLKSGIPLDHSLKLASSVMFIPSFSLALKKSAQTCELNLSRCLESTKLFDASSLWMLSMGEKTEKLPEVLSYMGEYYSIEMSGEIEKSMKTIEVLVVFSIGIMVGILVLGNYLLIAQFIVRITSLI